ncbi:sulfurtransferase TusA family protein [Catenovulum sp. SX2]|uniref:sulfurtransferase TusA family protein n=1 Tax=Catenovulum sp. SX2 TaxID=3398614 RepID=UPI003F86FCB3
MPKPIDCRDMRCPMPLLTLKLSLKKAQQGMQIQLLLRDAASVKDIPAWLKLKAYPFKLSQLSDNDYLLSVTNDNQAGIS